MAPVFADLGWEGMRSCDRLLVAGAVLVLLGGCASTEVAQTRRAGELEKPDRVLVRDFAVTLADVELDRGLGPTLWRDVQGEVGEGPEADLGRAAASALSDEMVKKLRAAGIPAERVPRSAPYDPRALIVTGRFLTMDEGNQTLRTVVGFGAGASEVRTQAQLWMAGRLVAEGETTARSGRKPGVAVTLGAGAALGTAATAAAVAAATTGISETMLTSVQADARRTAGELADRIIRAYRGRGWLTD
jgi:hypothetical protein